MNFNFADSCFSSKSFHFFQVRFSFVLYNINLAVQDTTPLSAPVHLRQPSCRLQAVPCGRFFFVSAVMTAKHAHRRCFSTKKFQKRPSRSLQREKRGSIL